MSHPFLLSASRFLALALLALTAATTGCSECPDYCALECSCVHEDESEACLATCHQNLEVFTGESLESECSSRLSQLEEECE